MNSFIVIRLNVSFKEADISLHMKPLTVFKYFNISSSGMMLSKGSKTFRVIFASKHLSSLLLFYTF